MDANAKVGNKVVPGDPHEVSDNGKLLLDLVERQNLRILNSSPKRSGVVTRHRATEQILLSFPQFLSVWSVILQEVPQCTQNFPVFY